MKTTVDQQTALKLIQSSFNETGAVVAVRGSPLHFVSSTGHVYSVWKSTKHPHGEALKLRPMRHSRGYPQVQVRRGGRARPVKIHTLVAEAFLPPPRPGQTVIRHWDDNPQNNHYRNLRWGTQVGNVADAKRNGRRIGRPPVYSEELVASIRAARARGHTYARIAKDHGVSGSYVSDLITNRRRKEQSS